MTIYEIKKRVSETLPYYFSRSTMKFFGQTMRGWSLAKQPDGRIRISQPIRDLSTGKVQGETIRYFNPLTNKLERK